MGAGGEIADGLAQGNGMLAHNRPPITASRPQIWLELPQPDIGLLCCLRRSENEGSPEIWAASQLREAKARGLGTSPTFKVSLYELLHGIDRGTSGDEYQRIVEAFERLSGTLIRTNIRQGKSKKPEGFHWVERYAVPTDEQGRPAGIEFTISDWLYGGILTDRLTLAIDREYFSLTGGIERWLYRVVRKHGGHQSGGWAFTMAQLHMKSGSTQRLADFAKELRRTVERQRLPGYWLQILRNSEGQEVLHFTERCQLPVSHPGFSPQRLPRTSIGSMSSATARGRNHDTAEG